MEYDYYILKMYGLIDPCLIGPLTKEQCDKRIEDYREDPSESQNSFTEIKVTKGAEIDV